MVSATLVSVKTGTMELQKGREWVQETAIQSCIHTRIPETKHGAVYSQQSFPKREMSLLLVLKDVQGNDHEIVNCVFSVHTFKLAKSDILHCIVCNLLMLIFNIIFGYFI